MKQLTIRKRSFLLFELLLSLTLLTLCFFPMVKTHFALTKEEIKKVEMLQLEREKERAFAEICTKLFENEEHSFSELQVGVEAFLDPIELCMGYEGGKLRKKTYERKYLIEPLECCSKSSIKQKILLVEVQVHFLAQGCVKGSFEKTLMIEEHG